MISSPCPNCGVMIQKNGGCPHMNCGACKYEFCWMCMGHYKGYKHDPGMDKYCGQASGVWIFLYMLFGLLIISKILMVQPIPIVLPFKCLWSLMTIRNILKTVFAFFSSILIFYMELVVIDNISRVHRRPWSHALIIPAIFMIAVLLTDIGQFTFEFMQFIACMAAAFFPVGFSLLFMGFSFLSSLVIYTL